MTYRITYLQICGRKPNYFIGLMCIPVLICLGCLNQKKYKKEYYPGTNRLKSEGYYLNNKPIDTIKRYSKEGWLASIDIYNNNGILNGKCSSFYKNGVPSEIITYKNGAENGIYLAFREDGTKKVVGFFFNGKPMGNVFFYDSLNRLLGYKFLGFNNQVLMAAKYDSNGKIIEGGDIDLYFMDSVRIASGENGIDTVKTLLLISHQPRTSIKMKIDNIGKDGKVKNSSDILADGTLCYYNNFITKDIDTIKEIAVRYDSVLRKTKQVTILRLTKYLRATVQ